MPNPAQLKPIAPSYRHWCVYSLAKGNRKPTALSVRILRKLMADSASSVELSAEIRRNLKDVAGTLSNLRRDRKVKKIATLPRKRGYAFLYAITNLGKAHIRRIPIRGRRGV